MALLRILQIPIVFVPLHGLHGRWTRQLDDFELCGSREGYSWSRKNLSFCMVFAGASNIHVAFFRVSFGVSLGFLSGFM